MSHNRLFFGLIGISFMLLVFGCSRTDNNTNRLADANVPDRNPENQNNSIAPKIGEKPASTNGDLPSTGAAPEPDNSEFQDSDEPRNREVADTLSPVQKQPLTEVRSEDGDDPNATPIEVPAEDRADNQPELDNGREAGVKPDSSQASNTTGPPAPIPATSEGREDSVQAGTKTDDQSPRVKQPLPEKLQSLDTNKDGQIALAEWPREKLADFTKLDKNKDGFLTSQEWLAAQPTSTSEEKSDTPQPQESSADGQTEPKKPVSDSDESDDDQS